MIQRVINSWAVPTCSSGQSGLTFNEWSWQLYFMTIVQVRWGALKKHITRCSVHKPSEETCWVVLREERRVFQHTVHNTQLTSWHRIRVFCMFICVIYLYVHFYIYYIHTEYVNTTATCGFNPASSIFGSLHLKVQTKEPKRGRSAKDLMG